ncbi:hypothetical protein [Vibrio phage vB_pir03]|nr:hypothetical protein [Vibrio phage vB_pir03]
MIVSLESLKKYHSKQPKTLYRLQHKEDGMGAWRHPYNNIIRPETIMPEPTEEGLDFWRGMRCAVPELAMLMAWHGRWEMERLINEFDFEIVEVVATGVQSGDLQSVYHPKNVISVTPLEWNRDLRKRVIRGESEKTAARLDRWRNKYDAKHGYSRSPSFGLLGNGKRRRLGL